MTESIRTTIRSRARWALVAASLALPLVVIAVATTPRGPLDSAPAPGPSPSTGFDGMTTSADGSSLMGPIELSPRPPSATEDLTISVDVQVEQQHINGFGAAMTHSSAAVLAGMPTDDRVALLTELFDPSGPVRLSTVRLPIGASDFVDTDAFTFDDLPVGETDWELERFSIEPDRRALIPMLQQVVAINPRVRLIASPWSPPAWLKTTGSLEGGRLLDEDRAYETYAAYVVRFLREYRDAGLEIRYLTVQNEPQQRFPDGYPGTDMPFWQEARLIEVLGPALEAAALDTAILGFDHNWELHPADAAMTPMGEDPAYQYPADLLHTPAATWIDGIAFHCYSGSAEAQSRLWDQFSEMEIWVTECSGSSAERDPPEQVFADTFTWQATSLLIDSLRNRASGVLTWNLALDENNGPHRGGCTTCSGVVTVAPDGNITRNAEYYVLAHAARFVPPGSVRVDSTTFDSELEQVAFRTADGFTTLIVFNPSDGARSVGVGDAHRSVTVTLPGRSLSSLAWPAP